MPFHKIKSLVPIDLRVVLIHHLHRHGIIGFILLLLSLQTLLLLLHQKPLAKLLRLSPLHLLLGSQLILHLLRHNEGLLLGLHTH
jgi:hypothetical protein